MASAVVLHAELETTVAAEDQTRGDANPYTDTVSISTCDRLSTP